MKVGLLVDLHKDFENDIKHAKELGFDFGQLVNWDMELYTDENLQKLKNVLEKYQFTVTDFWCGWSEPVVWKYPERHITLGLVPKEYRAQRLEDLRRGAEFAYKLGVKNIVTHISDKMPKNTEITVVCGTNKRLKTSLGKLAKSNSNIHIKGFVDNMPLYLDSTDLYLTKPGGLSTSEAVSKSVPMVFINAVAGCEAHNLKHFVNLGVAVTDENKYNVSSLCTELLNNDDAILVLKTAFESLPKINSANHIANFFKGE